jgi:hypothetical protein
VATADARARASLWTRLGAATADEVPALFLYAHQRVLLLGTGVRGVCSDGVGLDLRAASLGPTAAAAAP